MLAPISNFSCLQWRNQFPSLHGYWAPGLTPICRAYIFPIPATSLGWCFRVDCLVEPVSKLALLQGARRDSYFSSPLSKFSIFPICKFTHLHGADLGCFSKLVYIVYRDGLSGFLFQIFPVCSTRWNSSGSWLEMVFVLIALKVAQLFKMVTA